MSIQRIVRGWISRRKQPATPNASTAAATVVDDDARAAQSDRAELVPEAQIEEHHITSIANTLMLQLMQLQTSAKGSKAGDGRGEEQEAGGQGRDAAAEKAKQLAKLAQGLEAALEFIRGAAAAEDPEAPPLSPTRGSPSSRSPAGRSPGRAGPTITLSSKWQRSVRGGPSF